MTDDASQKRQEHWEHVYKTKPLVSVSWYQHVPLPSLQRIEKLNLSAKDAIIDIGGGDSLLADHLTVKGYSNVTVLDISNAALERAKLRLGKHADQINWIASDVLNFSTTQPVRLWHDRAAFHFLSAPDDLIRYRKIAEATIAHEGFLIIATFSTNGPTKCSGLEVKQYTPELLQNTLGPGFELIESETVDHTTPSGGIQNFLFATFRRNNLKTQ